MVLGLITAGLSIAQGVMGFLDAQDAKDEAKAAGRVRIDAANKEFAIANQSIGLELFAAQGGAELAKQSGRLSEEAALLDMEAIGVSNAATILDTLLMGENVRREFESAAHAADLNAKLERISAKRSRSAAATDAEDFGRRAGAGLASNRALQAASGLTGGGSPAKVDEAIVGEIMLGQARIRHAGDVKFFDHIIAAESLEKQSSDLRISKDASQFAVGVSVKNIETSTGIQLKGALLGFKAAQLQTSAAQLDLDIATRKSSIDTQTASISRQFGISSARQSSQSAVRSANSSAFNSVLGAVASVAGNSAVQNAFTLNSPTLATKGVFK